MATSTFGFVANRAALDVRPLGTLHPTDACAYCGDKGASEWLEKVVIAETSAWGWRCENRAACVRRQEEQRQMRLFGA